MRTKQFRNSVARVMDALNCRRGPRGSAAGRIYPDACVTHKIDRDRHADWTDWGCEVAVEATLAALLAAPGPGKGQR